MNDDDLAALQPGGAGDDAAVETPVVETPAVPAVPVAPVGDDGKLTDEQKAEADDWAKATDEIFPDLKINDKDKKDEPAKPEKKPEEKTEDGKNPEDKKPDASAGDGDVAKPGSEAKKPDSGNGTEEEGEDEPLEPTDSITRLTAREERQRVEKTRSDIRTALFKDAPTELRAGDGELLDSPEKVMLYNNPATGKPFTRDEATLYLSQEERKLQDNIKAMDAQVEQVTDTFLDLKDQTEVINYQYGELLRAMPDLRKQLWAQYEATLSKDAKTGVITKAPVSMQQFYETALEPYAQLGRQLEQQDTGKAAADTAAAEKAKQDADAAAAAKTQRRQDRSDIYGNGKVDTMTDEEKGWADAAKAVFGDALK